MSSRAMATFVLGSALGVGAMYISEHFRAARAARKAPPESSSERPESDQREISPSSVDDLPGDLALHEIYNRVSHAS